MRFIFKWLLRLFLLAVLLIVVFFLSFNSILRIVMEHNIRKQTGMDAEIGSFKLGLTEPTVEIQDLKIYNSTNFGGALFIDIPEIHAEYDRAALARSELHVTLLRFNLGELDIVKNQAGQTNIFSLAAPPAGKKAGGKKTFTSQTGLEFTGIDVLNVCVGKVQFIDLADPRNNRSQDIGLEDCVMKNVKTSADLGGLGFFIALRSGGFFGSLVDKNSGSGLGSELLQLLGN
jgi:uncharacterized protein involved in outer membrane biogenesis